jgi:hypothetical protein
MGLEFKYLGGASKEEDHTCNSYGFSHGGTRNPGIWTGVNPHAVSYAERCSARRLRSGLKEKG